MSRASADNLIPVFWPENKKIIVKINKNPQILVFDFDINLHTTSTTVNGKFIYIISCSCCLHAPLKKTTL